MTTIVFIVCLTVAFCFMAALEEYWKRRDKYCTWTFQDDVMWDYWETECHQAFCLEEGDPDANKMLYCCYCGGKLLVAEPEPEEYDDDGEA